MKLTLIRDDIRGKMILGVLKGDGLELQTLDRPWIPVDDAKGGVRSLSCVPVGEYRLVPHSGHRFGEAYAFVNTDLDVYHLPDDVPAEKKGKARTACLIHIGNIVSDSIGCTLVGTERTQMAIKGEPMQAAVSHSGPAMRKLREVLGREEHTLTITEVAEVSNVLEIGTGSPAIVLEKDDPKVKSFLNPAKKWLGGMFGE